MEFKNITVDNSKPQFSVVEWKEHFQKLGSIGTYLRIRQYSRRRTAISESNDAEKFPYQACF